MEKVRQWIGLIVTLKVPCIFAVSVFLIFPTPCLWGDGDQNLYIPLLLRAVRSQYSSFTGLSWVMVHLLIWDLKGGKSFEREENELSFGYKCVHYTVIIGISTWRFPVGPKIDKFIVQEEFTSPLLICGW